MKACKIFYPSWLKHQEDKGLLKQLIYELKYFDDGNIPVDYTAADHINVDTNIALSREHKDYDSWKDDPGGYAKHTYHWWKVTSTVEECSLNALWNALHVILLNQASSAGVERVFTSLTSWFVLLEQGHWKK
eukprot:7216538-Ditylum_brightwellii.AAC.1